MGGLGWDRIWRWWASPIVIAAFGVYSLVDGVRSDSWVLLAIGAFLVVIAWYLSPVRRGRHQPLAEAQSRAGDDELIMFWKPGCTVCIALERKLDTDVKDRMLWVNIWRDPAAADHVASLNGGDELTPTVVTGDGRRIERDAESITDWVRSHSG